MDAEKLARFARLDPKILRPIAHRTVAQQEALTLIRARNLIVRLRTSAVNAVRGLAKPCGYRLPASSTLCFAKRCAAALPPGLVRALEPVLEQIADMTVKIKAYDRAIKQLTETEYPETQALIKVYGVGQLTALTYVLTLGSKERFRQSRDVGCYLGLRPRRSQSGARDSQLGITKVGNVYLRSLLVECANHLLGRHGKDSSLRQWGLNLAMRCGKQARNRAIVAVARKLAVLLHRIWITQKQYDALTLPLLELKQSCSLVLTKPCSDDCVSGWAIKGRPKTGSIDFSHWTPTGTEPGRLTQSANRNTVENNMLCNRKREQKRTPQRKSEDRC
jgi:transposase